MSTGTRSTGGGPGLPVFTDGAMSTGGGGPGYRSSLMVLCLPVPGLLAVVPCYRSSLMVPCLPVPGLLEKLTVLWTIENLYYLPVVLYSIVILCDINSFVVNLTRDIARPLCDT